MKHHKGAKNKFLNWVIGKGEWVMGDDLSLYKQGPVIIL